MRRWGWWGTIVALGAIGFVGCTKLPDADSPAAKLYAARCNTCHRVYAPGLLKYPMWKYQVDRMQGEMERRGIPPLTPSEKATVLGYLKKYGG